MPLFALDLLARIIAGWIDAGPPHMGCFQSSSIISALCMLLGVRIRRVSPYLPCSPDDRITSHPVELGSDHNPSCSRASGSGWRDHPPVRPIRPPAPPRPRTPTDRVHQASSRRPPNVCESLGNQSCRSAYRQFAAPGIPPPRVIPTCRLTQNRFICSGGYPNPLTFTSAPASVCGATDPL